MLFAIESNLLNGGYKEKAFDHEDIHREDNGASSPFALLSDNLACPWTTSYNWYRQAGGPNN
jgi:hypothetical protein